MSNTVEFDYPLIERKLAYSRLEAAELLGVCARTVDRWVKDGLLRPSRASRRVLFSREELDRFLRETSEQVEL